MNLKPFELLNFEDIEATPCPCGSAKRGLMDVETVPYSFHITNISIDAKSHYHKRLTETYFILECDSDAWIEIDGQKISVKPHSAIVIHPGTRHRAVGTMKVAIVCSPKFDPSDEWFD